MADEGLKNPRRKRGSKRLKPDSPFPVPIQTFTGKTPHEDRWFHFEGFLRGNSVVIEKPGDMNFLCKMGFFGKGNLSRSKPEFEIIGDMSQKAITGSQRTRRLPPRERQICQSKFRVLRKERFKRHNNWVAMVKERSGMTEHNTSSLEITPGERTVQSSTAGYVSNSGEQMQSWDVTAGVSNVPELDSGIQTVETRKRAMNDNAQTEEPEDKRNAKGLLALGTLRSSGKDTTVDDTRSGDLGMSHFDKEILSGDEDECSVSCTGDGEHLGVMDCSSESPLRTGEGWNSSPNANDKHDTDCQGISKMPKDQEEEEEEETESDEDDSTQDEEDYERKKTILPDPYKIYEVLQLSLEESFFLSYGLGCLTVQDPTEERRLEISDLWRKCSLLKKTFVQSYVAYHHFRSKGWVPKPGIKYGCDWILYKQGMPFYHASYAVLVHMVSEDTKSWDWHMLTSHSRVSEHVAKEVLLCFVRKPADYRDDEMSSPKSIARFKVQEVLMRRWLPERARDPKC